MNRALQAFVTMGHPPNIQVTRSLGNSRKDEVTWVDHASSDSRLTVGYLDYQGKQVTFYIYYDGDCKGSILFDFMGGRFECAQAKLRLGNLVATPHASLDPSMRGKGIASFLYRRALKAGISFVADTHTKMAAALWEHIAKSTPGVNLYHTEHGRVVPQQGPTTYKVLTRKKLKK